MQSGETTKEQRDDEEPKGVTVTIRLMNTQADVEEKQLKVLQRTHVSHLLKTISWSFNKSGFYNQDFDAFLVHPDMEVHLELNGRIRDYGIKNQDIIEIRRKKLLISLQVNLHQEDIREYQVNASLPVYETVKNLGHMLGVENTKELSLALPVATDKSTASVTSISWLDPIKSLNAQGVTSGDTVLIRKKFFIHNGDIGEAENNPILRDLLYHQFQTQAARTRNDSRKVSQVCSYGIPSETSDVDSLSDQDESPEMSTFVSEVMMSLERPMTDSQTETAKVKWIQTLSKQKTLDSFFPIKSATNSESQYLCVQSNGVCITAQPQVDDEYVHNWSFEEITSLEKFENGLKIAARGESHTLFSDQIDQIVDHLKHLFPMMKDEEASGCKQDDTPSRTKLSLSPALSIPSSLDDYSSESSHEEKEEAGTGINESTSSGVEASVNCISSLSLPNSPVQKKLERTTNIRPPDYFGLSYKELLNTHILIHIIVLDQELRQILVNVTKPVRSIVRDICATYCIQYPGEHFLRYPKSTTEILSKYGGRPRLDSLTGEFVESGKPRGCKDELDGDRSLVEQLNFDIRPIVLLLRRRDFDEVDAVKKHMLDIGQEWPDGEDSGVARYRYFYQSWISVVQGARDINKHTAIRLAGILTYLYHGSKKSAPFWPPLGFDPKTFVPEKFKRVIGIENDILKFHKRYGDVDLKDAIEEVIEICEEVPFSSGLHFSIKVPTKSEILKLKKLESRVLCISKDGLLCLPHGGKGNCFRGDFSDVRNWASSDTSFRLTFGGKNGDFHAYTYQAKQIMEMMQIYVKMAYDDFQKNPQKVDQVSDV